MSLLSLEFQQCRKAPFPSKVSPVPNKTYFVEAFFAFYREMVFTVTLYNYPRAKIIFAFYMTLRRAAMTFSSAKFT